MTYSLFIFKVHLTKCLFVPFGIKIGSYPNPFIPDVEVYAHIFTFKYPEKLLGNKLTKHNKKCSPQRTYFNLF